MMGFLDKLGVIGQIVFVSGDKRLQLFAGAGTVPGGEI